MEAEYSIILIQSNLYWVDTLGKLLSVSLHICCSLPENILSLAPTSNSLTQKYIHFNESSIINAFDSFI